MLFPFRSLKEAVVFSWIVVSPSFNNPQLASSLSNPLEISGSVIILVRSLSECSFFQTENAFIQQWSFQTALVKPVSQPLILFSIKLSSLWFALAGNRILWYSLFWWFLIRYLSNLIRIRPPVFGLTRNQRALRNNSYFLKVTELITVSLAILFCVFRDAHYFQSAKSNWNNKFPLFLQFPVHSSRVCLPGWLVAYYDCAPCTGSSSCRCQRASVISVCSATRLSFCKRTENLLKP